MTQEIQKVVAKGTLLGQQIRNIFVGMWTDPTGLNVEHAFVNAYLDGVYSPLSTYLSTLFSLTEYEVYGLESDTAPQNWIFRYSHSYTFSGADTGEQMPNQIAALIIGKVSGWSGFGRKFFAGPTDTYITAGLIGASFLAALVQSAGGYITSQVIGGVAWDPGIAHYNKTTHVTTFRRFQSAVVTNLPATQRRRKIGVGM